MPRMTVIAERFGTAVKGLAAALGVVAATLFGIGVDQGITAMWVPSLLALLVLGVFGAINS